MDANELKATIAHLDDMRARCDAVIARDKPLQPDRTVGRKRLRPDYVAPKATGPLAGNEMTVDDYRRGYRPQQPRLRPTCDMGDGSLDAIFADFEKAFDEMAQAHRA